MSLATALDRVAELQSVLGARPVPAIAPTAAPAPAPAAAKTSFASALQSAAAPPTGGGNTALVQAAQGEVGQTEQPPGSNDSPRIAEYRTAVPGGPVGPWCAYFASWAARQAGVPIGDTGQGFARVDEVWAWASRTGRAIPSGPGAVPKPGDLVIWDEHMGIVESVKPDGSFQTIEGNSSDQVARRDYPAGAPVVGFVRMS